MKESVLLLEAWYRKHHRPLPWRNTQDPYSIWLSEIMLQQTQVATVIPYFLRFMERFPTVFSLAEGKESEILSLWSGLGYYSRARNLHKGAKFIVEMRKGAFPKTREEMLQIPGIGPYTAGAILSIAFNLREPLVDGNVFRVFSRTLAFKKCIDLPRHQRFFWDTARSWVQRSTSPRIFNQALMELGATVCTKAAPKCDSCPLIQNCKAYGKNLQEKLPLRKKRTKTIELHWNVSVYEKRGKVFLTKNAETDWWAGLWDLPRDKKSPEGELLCRQTHTVTHHKIRASAYLLKGKSPPKFFKGRWILKEEALRAPISSLSRKILLSLED